MTAKVIQVIETKITTRGTGKDSSSPLRGVTQYWSFDGQLLAESDPLPNHETITRMRETLDWLDGRGGLGLDVHDRIKAVLAQDK
jgi:hypothetical protein